MPHEETERAWVGLWGVAVLGAVSVIAAPLTPWVLEVELAGLAVCVVAVVALAVWFLRR